MTVAISKEFCSLPSHALIRPVSDLSFGFRCHFWFCFSSPHFELVVDMGREGPAHSLSIPCCKTHGHQYDESQSDRDTHSCDSPATVSPEDVLQARVLIRLGAKPSAKGVHHDPCLHESPCKQAHPCFPSISLAVSRQLLGPPRRRFLLYILLSISAGECHWRDSAVGAATCKRGWLCLGIFGI